MPHSLLDFDDDSRKLPCPEKLRASVRPATRSLARRSFLAAGASLLASSACAWTIHPERRGQAPGGRIDAVPLLIDILWFLPGLLPGAIFLAVDFASGAIYYRPAASSDTLEGRGEPLPEQIDAAAQSEMLVRATGPSGSSPVKLETLDEQARPLEAPLLLDGSTRREASLQLPAAGSNLRLVISLNGRAKHQLAVSTRPSFGVRS